MTKRTKIIATIGPSSSSPGIITMLIHAGMDAARLNFSHGERKDHVSRINLIRRVSRKMGKYIPIIQDLQGPKLRIGDVTNEGVMLRRGEAISLLANKVMGTSNHVSVTNPALIADLKAGDVILLDDGRLELRAVKKSASAIACTVVRGGILKSHKGINLPGATLTLPSLSKKDREDIRFGVKAGIDFIALSFVRTAQDIIRTRSFIRSLGANIPIIAKIEKPEAISNLDEIMCASDGIMVARGDLGVEMSAERVPLLQKQIIEACHWGEKPVITATQMLESMIENPQPTRAETSDVANAILDGTDCVMLSGETAVGKYPVQAVEIMSRIARQAESSINPWPPEDNVTGQGESVAHAACRAAQEQEAQAIVTFTQSGSTALLVSKHRPRMTIIAPTPFEHIARRVSLYWGVTPVILKPKKTTDAMISSVESIMLKKKLARRQDIIVITAGVPIGVAGSTNMMKIHRIGEIDDLE